MIIGVALAATMFSNADALTKISLDCEAYVRLSRLPNRFRMISSADLPGFEMFVLSDGACVCENTPALKRKQDKTIPPDLKWACRVAGPDEQPDSDQDAN